MSSLKKRNAFCKKNRKRANLFLTKNNQPKQNRTKHNKTTNQTKTKNKTEQNKQTNKQNKTKQYRTIQNKQTNKEKKWLQPPWTNYPSNQPAHSHPPRRAKVQSQRRRCQRRHPCERRQTQNGFKLPPKPTWKAKCPILKAIVAGFRGKVA